MKTNFFLSFLIYILLLVSCKKNIEEEYLSKAKEFQYKLNIEFLDKKTSPLLDDDFKVFSSLQYFPIKKKYRIHAKLIKTPNEELFDMLTTTNRVAKYVKYGIADFILDEKEFKLNIYQNVEGIKHLFLPYSDETNGKESYSGGKYIELSEPINDIIIIDFNQAYNPYCTYNAKYSCPIPPDDNYLDIEIKAGVKKFH